MHGKVIRVESKCRIKLKFSTIVSTFGTVHGTLLVDPAGKHWRDKVDSNGVGTLEGYDADLNKVTLWMWSNFGTLISDNSTIHKDCNSLREKYSFHLGFLPDSTSNFCNLLLSNYSNTIFQRHYAFSRCKTCQARKLWQCKDAYFGKRKEFQFTTNGDKELYGYI